MKPLPIYQSESLRAFKKHNVHKTQLPAMWRSNSKVWETREYFSEWFNVVFGPSVKSYLEKNLPLKAVILDNAPAHSPGTSEGGAQHYEDCTHFRLGGGGDRGSPYFTNRGNLCQMDGCQKVCREVPPQKPKPAVIALSGMTTMSHFQNILRR